jgi:predicted transcriptional regulator
MKTRVNLALDKEDEEIIRLFTEIGMPKHLSKTLMYISQVDECSSADVEKGTNLRQPEVSIAMQELRRRGWVQKRELKKKGKGRPVHIYKTTVELSEVVKIIEQEKLKELTDVKNDITELKNIILSIMYNL